jgi:hypothetical protein
VKHECLIRPLSPDIQGTALENCLFSLGVAKGTLVLGHV